MEQIHTIKEPENFSIQETKADIKKGIGELFSSIPAWALFLIIVLSYSLLIALGNYMGYQRFLNGIQQPAPPTEAAVGSVFALLAFMLGFAFSSTWTRFIRRNVFVMAHAKAITTCYLRTSLITEPQKSEVRKLLQEYTRALLGIYTSAHLQQVLPRINEVHLLLWRQTASLAKEDIDSELRSLFTASVNDLITVAMERKTVALFIRIPNAIWNSLIILATIAMLAFGYQAGVEGISTVYQIPLLPLSFGLVIVLIADLNSRDSKRQFQVTKRPLREVLEMMAKDIS